MSRFGAGFFTALALVLVVAAVIAWREGLLSPQPTVAIVTNNADPFWDPVIRGAQDAAKECGLKLKVVKGNGDPEAQSSEVRQLLDQGISGLGISPIDPKSQTGVLRQAALKIPLVTFDSDCPESSRLWFVGTDNYGAGRHCGNLVREALPDGGEVLICVGSVTAENGRLRRQGVIDELLDRTTWGTDNDPIDGPIKGQKYTIVGTCVDLHDKAKATQLATEQIKAHPNLKCIVALYSYSAPATVDALRQTGKVGQVKVIGFDVLPETLAGVESGDIIATLQQAQYNFGFDTVRALSVGVQRNTVLAASSPMRYFQVIPVTKEDVAKVRQEIEQSSSPVASAAK
jgi:ribose transport system substrate-binding protein